MLFNNFFKKRRSIAISALALLVITITCIAIRSNEHYPVTVWSDTENDVNVKISIVKSSSGQLTISGVFRPTRAGFYLYSKDLPKDGLLGLGRPALLEVVTSNSVKITGVLDADQPVEEVYYNVLDISLPVYPPGPVRLSIPFELTGNSASMELSITYMACSDKTCMPPVINKLVDIQIPEKFLDE
jgi:hypothetical protein